MFGLDEKMEKEKKEKKEKNEAEIPPEERIRKAPGFRNHCPLENETFFINGQEEIIRFEIKVSCGTRLCGYLNKRRDDCIHNPTTRCLEWQPKEWEFYSRWRGGVFGNPFKVRHTPHMLGPVLEPIWDFNNRGEWVQMRDVPDELKDCDWVKEAVPEQRLFFNAAAQSAGGGSHYMLDLNPSKFLYQKSTCLPIAKP
ncbi:hypothetical protein BDU57DRAFT_597770 [Ampelomyces quisqualis]|uniref:Uncharacterized protein n=1 Tax=Ampelomyces quisqualis TaxID=50730 RepID=A0A6A5QF95_AMPQU|nr:hypothetical protein BDU57DRAFT_597770 [Ampelomyces quisqualis]